MNFDVFKSGYAIAYKHEETRWPKSFFGNQIVKKQLAVGFSAEHAQYSHVEICGGKIRDKAGRIVGIQSINVSPPKSRWIDITKVHKGRYVCVLKHKDYDKDPTIRYQVAYASARLNNVAYDKRGILAFGLSWITQNNRLYFCSEHCSYAVRIELPRTFDIDPDDKITPAYFFLPHWWVKVWEGRIE